MCRTNRDVSWIWSSVASVRELRFYVGGGIGHLDFAGGCVRRPELDHARTTNLSACLYTVQTKLVRPLAEVEMYKEHFFK